MIHLASVVVEFHDGIRLTALASQILESKKYLKEEELWTMLIQGLLMLMEYRKFGLVNCRMPPWCFYWIDHKTLKFYPRSFIGLAMPSAVDVEGVMYAPNEDISNPELVNGDIFNLGLIIYILIKPDFEFFDHAVQDFKAAELLNALGKGDTVFFKKSHTSYSKELQDLLKKMLNADQAKRPTIGIKWANSR